MASFVPLNKVISLSASLRLGPGGLFTRFRNDLFQGKISAYSSRGSRGRIQRHSYRSIQEIALKFECDDATLGIISEAHSNDVSHASYYLNNEYISITSATDGFDVITQIDETMKRGTDLYNYHWKWAWNPPGTDTIICDNLHVLIRSVFHDVVLLNSDLDKRGYGEDKESRKRRGPRGFYNEEVVAYAYGLLEQQPDIEKAMFERLVREQLEKHQADERWRYPSDTAFRDHYGKLWTAHRGMR